MSDHDDDHDDDPDDADRPLDDHDDTNHDNTNHDNTNDDNTNHDDNDHDDGRGGIWSPAYLAITLANLTIVAISAFDGLALVAALPAMADDLGDIALLPWVITAFLATSAVAGITAGPIIDAIGVRTTFRLTGLWFLVTSALAAVAPTMPFLVAARLLQGIGGGLVISVALAGVGLAYPNRLRARAFAANSMVWGVMGFGGPVIAAGLLALGSWRLIFIVQLPITAIALAAGWRTLPGAPAPVGASTQTSADAVIDPTRRPSSPRSPRTVTDAPGIAIIVVLVGASLVAVSEVGARWWLVAVGTAVSAVSVVAFWRHIGRAEHPLVDRAHLTRFPLRRIHVTSGLALVAGLCADNYLPLYVQTTRGRSESFAAFSVMFLTVGWTVAAFVVSRLLERRHEADMILAGSLLMMPAVGLAGVGVALTWPLPVVFSAFFTMGAAIGLITTSGLTLLQSSAAGSEMGRVNAAHQFIRTICITYGVAVGGAILLLVVDRQVGDVEAVRDVLRGEGAIMSSSTLDAIRDGLAWVHVFSAVVGLACIAGAVTLWRLVRAAAPAATRH